MQAFICDKCHKVVEQVITIDAHPRSARVNITTWSSHGIEGDYCEECIEKIGEFITGWKKVGSNHG